MLYVARYVLPVGPDTYIPGDILQGPLDWPNLQYLISLRRLMPVHSADEAMQAMLGVGVSEELAAARVSKFFDAPALEVPPNHDVPRIAAEMAAGRDEAVKLIDEAFDLPEGETAAPEKPGLLSRLRPGKRKAAANKPPAKRRGRPRTKA